MTVPYDEARALKLLADGKQKGFELIYEYYAPKVARLSYRLLRSEQQAEDLMQEIFIKVWVERDRFVKADSFPSYLFTCVRHRAFDYIKERTKEDVARIKAAALKVLDESTVDNYIRDQELAELVNQAVEELPAQRKRVFSMMIDQGLSQKDIAEQLNIDVLTVRNHIHYARTFIWQRIEPHVAVSVYIAISASIFS